MNNLEFPACVIFRSLNGGVQFAGSTDALTSCLNKHKALKDFIMSLDVDSWFDLSADLQV
jgi:hypothetical protein